MRAMNRPYLVGDEVYGAEVEVVLLADLGELGVEVDLVPLDEALESFEVVVDDAVVEAETPAAAAAAAHHAADAGHARRHTDRRRNACSAIEPITSTR